MGALGGDEADQQVTAGDEHQRARGARQEGPHLLGITRVVQHDEHSSTSDEASIERRLFIWFGRSPLGWYAEGFEETPYHLGRLQRRMPWIVSAQVHVQLAIVKAV